MARSMASSLRQILVQEQDSLIWSPTLEDRVEAGHGLLEDHGDLVATQRAAISSSLDA